jgi:hypothetical protein
LNKKRTLFAQLIGGLGSVRADNSGIVDLVARERHYCLVRLDCLVDAQQADLSASISRRLATMLANEFMNCCAGRRTWQ